MRDGLFQWGVDERMTAGTNGGGTPENDDPFSYLYRREGDGGVADEGATAQQPRYEPGVPRTSYHQVTRVGQTTYGQRAQQGQSYPLPGQQDTGAPVGGRAARRDTAAADNRRSLLTGAVAVVAAVAVGIGIAVYAGDDDTAARKPSSSAGGQSGGEETGGGESRKEKNRKGGPPRADRMPPVTDAASLTLSGGAVESTEFSGALAKSGAYVQGMQTPGATATWKVKVPEAGQYRFNIRYGNAGDDVKGTVVVNGKPQSINLGNFAKQDDWSKAWTRSYGVVNLQKGTNVLDLTCEGGDKCAFNVDQVALTRSGYPPNWP